MNPQQTDKLFRTASLVVAHPDDEILWFSSIIAQLAQVIVCFHAQPDRPKFAQGRQAVLADYPLDTISSLGLEAADVYDYAQWHSPVPTHDGLALNCRHDSERATSYRGNHASLVQAMRSRLAGFDTVFTHNPWGEYGHEEHVQVYRAVRQAQVDLGFELWTSAYVGTRSHALMTRCLEGAGVESITLETDASLAKDIADRYKEHGVWTWFDDYQWPEHETFLRITPGQRTTAVAIPLSYLNMDRPTISLADRSLRDMVRKVRRAWLRRTTDAPYL